MAHRFAALKSFSTKAVSVLASGALALSLTPAIALANTADLQAQSVDLSTQHYEYENGAGKTKAIIGKSDPLNEGVELVSKSSNVYKYRGYAHSDDGGHYVGYSLYTEITTDSKGVITAIDLTSGNDTFAGKWGYLFTGHGARVIEGYLPEGVNFNAIHNADGSYTPNLTGADSYGFSVNSVTLVSTNADGTEYDSEVATASSTKGTWSDNKVTIVDPDVNLVIVNYIIGSEKVTFNTYFAVGDKAAAANEYLDTIEPTEWDENPTSGYETNRGRWTHIMGTVALRELSSWGAAMENSKLSTGLDGEVGAIDTVSGATKTAAPFAAALNTARQSGYVKGVSENVRLTIDGKNSATAESLPSIDVSADSKDRTTVSLNDSKQYVANVVFPYQDTLKRNDNHGVTLDKVSVYALGDQTVGTQGMMTLAKQNSGGEAAYTALAEYTPASLKLNPTTTERNGKESTNYSWYPAGTEVGAYVTSVDDDNIKLEYEVSDYPIIVTAKNASVTHVVMTYTLGHGSIAIAYDLANMSKVAEVSQLMTEATAAKASSVKTARDKYDALPYDVRPFTTGIDNLTAAEATIAAKTVTKGDTKTVSGQSYKVTKVATSKANGTVTFTKAKNAKSVTVPATVKLGDGKTYKVTQVAAGSFTASKIRTVTIGTNVTKIAPQAFKGSKATKAVVKTTSLKKANVKNCFKGSKVTTVKVPAKKLAAYKKIFTKKITGASKTLKVTK